MLRNCMSTDMLLDEHAIIERRRGHLQTQREDGGTKWVYCNSVGKTVYKGILLLWSVNQVSLTKPQCTRAARGFQTCCMLCLFSRAEVFHIRQSKNSQDKFKRHDCKIILFSMYLGSSGKYNVYNGKVSTNLTLSEMHREFLREQRWQHKDLL